MLLPVDAVLQNRALAALATLCRIARLRQVHAHLTMRRGAKQGSSVPADTTRANRQVPEIGQQRLTRRCGFHLGPGSFI